MLTMLVDSMTATQAATSTTGAVRSRVSIQRSECGVSAASEAHKRVLMCCFRLARQGFATLE